MIQQTPEQGIGARFSAASATYEESARVQAAVAARLAELIEAEMAGHRVDRILEVGCGTGLLTRRLVALFPDAEVTAIDIADAMIRVAKDAVGRQARVRWVASGVAGFRTGQRFPLIVSSSALHWITPLDSALRRLAGMLAPGGTIAIALMVDGTLRELHELRRRVAPTKIPPGRLPTHADVEAALSSAGLCLRVAERVTHRDAYASGWDFLRTIHALGLTGGAVSHGALPLNRRELGQLAGEYDRTCRMPDGRVSATYEVLYGLATSGGAS